MKKKAGKAEYKKIAAVVAFVALAAVAYFVSVKLSAGGKIAPNAPESQPAAAGGCLKNPRQCRKTEFCDRDGRCKKVPVPTKPSRR